MPPIAHRWAALAEHRDLKLLRLIIFPSPWGELLLEQEAVMRGKVWAKRMIGAGAGVGALLTPATPSWGQGPAQPGGQQMDPATVWGPLPKLNVSGHGLPPRGKNTTAVRRTPK